MRARALGACLALALGLCACGGADAGSTTVSLPPLRGPKPPKNASPMLRALYRNFQPPLPDPESPGSARAIQVGERACRGKSPGQVARHYLPESDLSTQQRQALKQLPSAEEHPSADFVAGQLAALVYQGTLSGPLAEYGYRGCVYGLAAELKRRLRG